MRKGGDFSGRQFPVYDDPKESARAIKPKRRKLHPDREGGTPFYHLPGPGHFIMIQGYAALL
jgi:hypothetical protein